MAQQLDNDFSGSRLCFYDGSSSGTSLAPFLKKYTKIDRAAIYDFLLYGTMLPPHTPLEGVKQLYPGEHGRERSRLEFEDLDYRRRAISLEDAVDELDTLLQGYVSKHSDVRALLLSGGIDSATIASYMHSPIYVTWGGRGEKTPDVHYSKITAQKMPPAEHIFVFSDFEHDLELYKKTVQRLKIPILFNSAVPFIRMGDEAKRRGIGNWFMGQNADTLFMAYPAPVLTKRLSYINKFLPLNPLSQSRSKKKYLFSTSSPFRLMAYFKSLGAYPAQGVRLPEGYFEEQEKVLAAIPTRSADQKIIVLEELLTESRRNQICQHEIPALFGITAHCPYYEKDFVQKAITYPPRLRARGGYQKVVLKKLAEKRGVPHGVIYKNKSGLSYGLESFIAEQRHISLWNSMEKHEFLNDFLDVRALRAREQDNYLTFIMLMSLYWWFELVAKPDNLILQ